MAEFTGFRFSPLDEQVAACTRNSEHAIPLWAAHSGVQLQRLELYFAKLHRTYAELKCYRPFGMQSAADLCSLLSTH